MPEISIIVPNYNSAPYLERCLKSLRGQTFSDIEIIIIDDGSTDNSVAIIRRYQTLDPRIHLIRQKNAGPAAARNQGLKSATGRYLMFCDSDDWYEPTMCQILYQTIEAKNADVVCCQNFFEFEKGLNSKLKKKRFIQAYFNPPLKEGFYPVSSDLRFTIPVLLWQKIFRKDLIDQFHLSFINGNKQDDSAFWYQVCFIANSIFYLPVPLYHYFIRNHSIAAQTLTDQNTKKESFQVAQHVFLFCKKHHLLHLYPERIIALFLNQLQFSKDTFSLQEGRAYAQRANAYLKKLPLYCRILFTHSNFRLCYHSPNLFLLKLKEKWLYLKSFIGTHKQRQKRKRKISEIQFMLTAFQGEK